MHIKDWKKDIFTIPNLLSLFRLILIPVYVAIYLNAEETSDYYLAAGILAVSCLTDLIDGKVARHFNMISNLGKLLDPVADKLTQFALIMCLTAKYPVLWFLVGLFVIKESFQLIAGGIRYRMGSMLKGALLSGKICTTILFLSLIVMVMLPNLNVSVVNIIVVVDALFMLIAFVDYILAYFFKDSKFQSLEEKPQ
ncbi:MAG: CDP-alcohol phosphatidyltransferase family protein [Oscillospiraceae bacterium]|nr:CDP-alcohol phosphatidyltransferase family protein [Oscillospiraceae bacterium]